MKVFLLILMASACGQFAHKASAQGKVDIIVDPAIQEDEEDRINRRKANADKVRGYRIMIGFYASRSQAESLRAEAATPFGARYGVTVIYDEPNFKVYVGEFTNSDDADAALAEIRKKYPGASRVSDIVRRRGRRN